MERNSGKRGWIYYYDSWDKLSQLTPLERGMLIDLVVPYSRPGDTAFEIEPDLNAVFPDATPDQMRLYKQSWNILAENAQDDDAKLMNKNVKRQYSAFRTCCMKYGHIAEEEVLTYEEWEELGMPGWSQWNKLGRPVPPPKPITMKDGTTVTVPDGTVTVPFATVTDRDGPNANNNNNSTFNNNYKSTFSNSGSVNQSTVPPTVAGSGRFVPPALEEVKKYFRENNLVTDPVYFFRHYSSVGWRNITDWKSRALNWDTKDRTTNSGKPLPQTQETRNEALYKYVRAFHDECMAEDEDGV